MVRPSQLCGTSASAMLTFDTVRELGGTLPDVVDGTAYGAPALKLSGKVLACVPTNKSADANSIVVRIDPEQRAELLRQDPKVYYITDHYAPHPTVLVRLSKISRTDLTELLRDACRYVMPSVPKTLITTRRPKSAVRHSGVRKKARK